jgi:hypothetical protein
LEGRDGVDCDPLGTVDEETYPQRTVYECPPGRQGWGRGGVEVGVVCL